MILQESGENYLETILMLQQQNGSVRSIDIATHMNFTKASVSRAMSILKRENYILMEADGNIILTETGLAKANAVLERHLLLTRFYAKILAYPKKQLKKMPAGSNMLSAPNLYRDKNSSKTLNNSKELF